MKSVGWWSARVLQYLQDPCDLRRKILLVAYSLAHADFDMHRSGGGVRVASCVLLTRLVETTRVGITDVKAIDRHTDATTVDIVVRFDGIVVAVPGSVVAVREIGLAPRAVELTVSVPLADLRERNLTIRGNADDSLFIGCKIEEKPGVAACAGHGSTRSLPVITNFVPQSNSNWALGIEGDGVVVAVGIAIA